MTSAPKWRLINKPEEHLPQVQKTFPGAEVVVKFDVTKILWSFIKIWLKSINKRFYIIIRILSLKKILKWIFFWSFTISIFKFRIDDVNDSRLLFYLSLSNLITLHLPRLLYFLLISRRRRCNLSPNHITVMTWLKLFLIANPVDSTAIHSRWTYVVRHVLAFILL